MEGPSPFAVQRPPLKGKDRRELIEASFVTLRIHSSAEGKSVRRLQGRLLRGHAQTSTIFLRVPLRFSFADTGHGFAYDQLRL